jgi:hypothetical protein
MAPLANGLIRHAHAAFQPYLFHIPKAQAKSEVQPDRVADNLHRKAVMLIFGGSQRCVHALITSYQTAAWQASPEVHNAYATFPPTEARRLRQRLEFIYTPKHGSWLNMAEIELSVFSRQCLNRRLGDRDTVTREGNAWERRRNDDGATVDWRFTTADARIKLKRLYPVIYA